MSLRTSREGFEGFGRARPNRGLQDVGESLGLRQELFSNLQSFKLIDINCLSD